ncbi:MAG: deoxyribose-phosphate aldolase [Polyangiaceae bacterium]|nr:deoxyribose-phosphate aldolase [Polyangiaceae bacterium]
MTAGASGRVVVASDHGGFALKGALVRHLRGRGVDALDVGTHSADACDYPLFARAAAEAVATGQASRGIVIDGAGIGSCMVANKVPGVRAGMAFDVATAKNAREHNDANLLTLGAGYLDEKTALAIVDTFLATDCTVDRHKRRVAMIDALDRDRPRLPMKTSLPMASNAGDGEALVRAITQVLTQNPGLVAAVLGSGAAPGCGSAGGAACSTCTGCGHCVSKRTDEVRAVVGSAAASGARVSSQLGVGAVPADVAKLIDHTLLRPDATYAEIDKLCDEAAKFGFASVCVNPVHVKRCAQKLAGAAPVVCTVVGFPLGATPRENKALEARRAMRDGAREIDMVIAIGALKSGDLEYVYEDIRAVAEVCREGRALCKVIIETALLTDEEKVAACVLAKRARADFVKTSTGFAKGGATAHDVALMARAVDFKLRVKASGGVGSAADAQKMIEAGASRIGASVGVKIAQEARGEKSAGGKAAAAY